MRVQLIGGRSSWTTRTGSKLFLSSMPEYVRGEKMQELGLVNDYRSNDDVKFFCGMLDGLAFLPVDKVSEGMAVLRQQQPDCDGISVLVDYFDATYVSQAWTGHCAVAQAPPFDEHRRPLAPSKFFDK